MGNVFLLLLGNARDQTNYRLLYSEDNEYYGAVEK